MLLLVLAHPKVQGSKLLWTFSNFFMDGAKRRNRVQHAPALRDCIENIPNLHIGQVATRSSK